jgi:ArsR family transcriptional regulator
MGEVLTWPLTLLYIGTVINSIVFDAISLENRVGLFKALADPHRLKILTILEREVRCNCHLQDLLDLAPNLLSYHLKILREAGLIVGERRGRWIDYSIAAGAKSLLQAAVPMLDVATSADPDGEC